MTKADALKIVLELVVRFEEQLPTLKNSKYKEHNLRMEFLNPFWEALGWDIHNTKGLPQSYKEVEQEDTLKIENLRGAPDYCFRKSKDKRFFYLEAKKPIENIKENNAHALQTRTYGWNGNLNISILSDFEEFGLYDCTKKPKETDTVRTARLEYMTYKDYEKNFDFLWDTFSRDAVFGGSIDQFASKKIKRGKDTVDKEFLISLDKWRTQLAENISLRNKNEIDEDQLNFAVQQIIDRLIFLRIAEDRNIEPYGNLSAQLSGDNYYRNILGVFTNANNRYNSGLFDPTKDTTTTELEIDNKVIKEIVSEMYYPKSPYLFDVISVEILGSAYEQFLGKVITINEQGKAKIELKPEVRKAGGVYYTPQYIVDYIVENTVGKLLENKKPLEASELKICDPACGSGSFLLGAYQYLLNWHKDYYIQHPHKKNPLTPEGNLTTAEKKRILLNNIYGVDIDANAVEVTKLSLLLKCMEGETQASIAHQMTMFNERVLPALDDNIKSGNSLIDTDFYDGMIEFEERKIKPFNWQRAFPNVFQNGGFDVIIGNPPWVSLNGKFGNDILNIEAQEYLIKKYSGNTYMPNLYEYFVHKGLDLINENGLFSFIVPDRLGFNNQFVKLRERILIKNKIVDLVYKAPFPGIVTDTLIFIFSKNANVKKSYKFNVCEYGKEIAIKTKEDYIEESEYKFTYQNNSHIKRILDKIYSNSHCYSLSSYAESTSGFGGKSEKITSSKIDKNQIPILRGRNVFKNSITESYFFEFIKDNITGRTTDKNKLGAVEKVLLRKTGNPIFACYDDSGVFPEQSLYFAFNKKTSNSLKCLSAFLNSKLFQFTYINKLVTNKDSTPQLKKVDLDTFPVYVFDLKNKIDKELHDQIVSSVDQLLNLNKDLQAETLESKREQIKRKIDHYEDKINELVYKLYDLTEEEIAIIEK